MRGLILCCAASLGALAAAPAAACLYTHVPAAVSGPTAAFIAGRMTDQAAFVDLATPERAEPMRTPDGRPLPAQAVIFRVTERLKGASPGRFTLFASGLKPAGTPLQREPLLHWVDGNSGDVTPHATKWEAPATEQFGMTSCDPGFIEPIRGRTYLVFRAADGGLLGPVAFRPGARPARGFPFVDALEAEWLRVVRSRTAATRRQRPSVVAALPPPFEVDSARASVAFRRLLTEAEARQSLWAAGARPYVVYTHVAGQSGEHRLPDAQASLDALAVARREVAATLGGPPGVSRGLGERARLVVRDYTPKQLAADPQKLRYARALVGSVEDGEKRAAEARADGAFVYGVEFTGAREAQNRLSASPLVREVRPGYQIRGRPVAPEPLFERPEPAASALPRAVDTMTPPSFTPGFARWPTRPNRRAHRRRSSATASVAPCRRPRRHAPQ